MNNAEVHTLVVIVWWWLAVQDLRSKVIYDDICMLSENQGENSHSVGVFFVCLFVCCSLKELCVFK